MDSDTIRQMSLNNASLAMSQSNTNYKGTVLYPKPIPYGSWRMDDVQRDGISKMMEYFKKFDNRTPFFNIYVGLDENGKDMWAELSGSHIYYQLKSYWDMEFYSDNSRDILNGIRECYLQHRVKG